MILLDSKPVSPGDAIVVPFACRVAVHSVGFQSRLSASIKSTSTS